MVENTLVTSAPSLSPSTSYCLSRFPLTHSTTPILAVLSSLNCLKLNGKLPNFLATSVYVCLLVDLFNMNVVPVFLSNVGLNSSPFDLPLPAETATSIPHASPTSGVPSDLTPSWGLNTIRFFASISFRSSWYVVVFSTKLTPYVSVTFLRRLLI